MESFVRSVPRITLFILAVSGIISVLATYDVVTPAKLALNHRLYKNREVWRAFTSFFYHGRFDFGTFLHFLLLFSSSKQMELSGSAQYLYFVFLIYSCSLLLSFAVKISFISDIFFMALVYVNCRRNREARVALFGLPFQISASYLPFIIFALNFSESYLIGIVFGHFYYFFEDVYPKLPNSRNKRIFNSPIIFFKISDFLKL